jgi:hypothetical protein
MATLLAIALAAIAAGADDAAPKPAATPDAPATLEVESAKWESGYGVKFFQVVGSVRNAGTQPLGAVQVHTELLDDAGAVVAEVDCWNGRAEALGDLRPDAARAKLARAKLEPIPPGGSDKWRCTFLEEDAPKFSRHRARVAAALPAP